MLALPLTVEALRHMISAPVDAGEEERREQVMTHFSGFSPITVDWLADSCMIYGKIDL